MYSTPPAVGHAQQITKDVLWCRMPLPLALDHINVYLVRDGNGWAIIDCGMATRETITAWTSIIEQLDGPITRVIVTHMHPDHIGCAGYLTETYRVDLYMSQTEYYAARALYAGSQGADNWQERRYYRAAGFTSEQVTQFTQSKGGFGKVVSPLPVSFIRLVPGETLALNNCLWQLILGLGHSPEHISLFNPELDICIGGDQVLPKITPNIGAYSTQPQSNPLYYYLQTLQQFAQLPQSTLLLPSHKNPIHDIPKRVSEIIHHHHIHLDNLILACITPQTLVNLLPVMFKQALGKHQMFFAVAECLAHLNYLLAQDKLTCDVDANGVNQYQTKP